MAATEILGPLRALASLLPAASGNFASDHLALAAKQLTKIENDALQKFRDAGDRCIEKLSGNTIVLLQRLLSGTRAIARSRRDSIQTDDGKAQSVYELLEKFDVDKDGVLSRKEFLDAARQLLGEFEVKDLEKLVNEVDRNKDGSVDIHEFTVWLYGAQADVTPKSTNGKAQKKDEAAKDHVGWDELRDKLGAVTAELSVKTEALRKMEDRHEMEMDASLNFWRGIAKNSIHTLDKKINLDNHEWLGNGKFGFVLKAVTRSDNKEVVVKMMGLRWAHLAVKEWQFGKTIGKCSTLVDYDDVMLHNDDDKSFEKLLKTGYELGKLKSRTARSKFPDRYVCLTEELMNRGTVQDWIDHGNLLPGGMLCVMKSVASALAFMHAKGVTHNDIKPENVMCHQDNPDDERSHVTVKLGDLGCATMSSDTVADYWQYGMTAFCMITGEKFGARKYMKENVSGFCDECAAAVKAGQNEGALGVALSKVPDMLRRVFPQQQTMEEVQNDDCLQGWTFFDGESNDAQDSPASLHHPHSMKPRAVKAHPGMQDATARRAERSLDLASWSGFGTD